MGLDNFWTGSVDGEFHICGGTFSSNGNDSFRGKVYNCLIIDLTDYSLYDDLSEDQVRRISAVLQDTSYERAKEAAGRDISLQEWTDFQRMWAAHAEAGHELKAWS
jgi:hypothetical protein